MGLDACPFCESTPDRIFHDGRLIRGIWDGFPVSPGHALLVPKRHVASWFDATEAELHELVAGIAVARQAILARHKPDGFNIGVNVGAAAGQTVFHLHVHVIPRYTGDSQDPRGGVRHVLPVQANYLVTEKEGAIPTGLPHSSAIVRGGEDPFLPHLLASIDRAKAIDLAVAFVLESGVRQLMEHLGDLLDRGGRVRLLTGDYLDVTDPAALLHLLDLVGSIELRIFETSESSFHPKAYLIHHSDGSGTAYVGSSNLTSMALGKGIEWNYRVLATQDRKGFGEVGAAFEALFRHPATRPITFEWIEAYRKRRRPPLEHVAEVLPEATLLPPQPHIVQQEALVALEQTRVAGNSAGLVVLATGLGKTWLSAFDSNRPEYRRVLFVAHREEILSQAQQTFRRIRPEAKLGRYDGTEKRPAAEVLFASIQTLGRLQHLRVFARDDFDYLVVDEFHHAAALTYRKLIDYFAPKFLLGLTATPERTDGGDLLALCQENLVYRRDLLDGIRLDLLAPYRYFGVPDDVDYANIPWRNTRFDEEALTAAVATLARAANVLEQYRKLAGKRTLAFCCSQRHSDFMAEFFREAGLRAVAVHAGPASAPRAASLERLEAGELDIVCAVDMFNEGVDLPHVDTIMMLRPTESRILWLQQFGRGLRKSEGKEALTVIDYIGNHRVFLLKVRALFELGSGDGEVARILDQISANRVTLPPGCSVTYDLQTVDILRALLRPSSGAQLFEAYYTDFRDRRGERPLAVEAYHDGYNPRTVRTSFGSWLRFVDAMGDLTTSQKECLEECGEFLDDLEKTRMTKSFKMVVLMAMLSQDVLPGSLPIAYLATEFKRIVTRSAVLRDEVETDLDDPNALHPYLEKNPIDAWCKRGGTGKKAFFDYKKGVFRSTFRVSDSNRNTFRELTRELVDWRLAQHLRPITERESTGLTFIGKVRQSSGRPMIFLPDRTKTSGLPVIGWTPLVIDDVEYQANFVKVALNVVRQREGEPNSLPVILQKWFGQNAGQPGTSHQVVFQQVNDVLRMMPATTGPA